MDGTEYLQVVGDRIRRRREAMRMSQDDLRRACGYSSRSTVTLIEKGRRDTPLSKIALIAKVLGVPPESLTYTEHRQAAGPSAPERGLLIAFSELNEDGQAEAVKRVEELSELPKYTKKSSRRALSA